jgi:hypothetical protein
MKPKIQKLLENFKFRKLKTSFDLHFSNIGTTVQMFKSKSATHGHFHDPTSTRCFWFEYPSSNFSCMRLRFFPFPFLLSIIFIISNNLFPQSHSRSDTGILDFPLTRSEVETSFKSLFEIACRSERCRPVVSFRSSFFSVSRSRSFIQSVLLLLLGPGLSFLLLIHLHSHLMKLVTAC